MEITTKEIAELTSDLRHASQRTDWELHQPRGMFPSLTSRRFYQPRETVKVLSGLTDVLGTRGRLARLLAEKLDASRDHELSHAICDTHLDGYLFRKGARLVVDLEDHVIEYAVEGYRAPYYRALIACGPGRDEMSLDDRIIFDDSLRAMGYGPPEFEETRREVEKDLFAHAANAVESWMGKNSPW